MKMYINGKAYVLSDAPQLPVKNGIDSDASPREKKKKVVRGSSLSVKRKKSKAR